MKLMGAIPLLASAFSISNALQQESTDQEDTTVGNTIAVGVKTKQDSSLVSPRVSRDIASTENAGRYLTTIPLGGSLAEPAKNTFFLCPNNLGPLLMDASPRAEWVDEVTNIIDTTKLAFIQGSVEVEGNFCIDTSNNQRRLYGNGLPNHKIGQWPITEGTPAYQYYAGRDCVYKCYPSATETQVNPYKLDITIPKNPKYNAMPTCMGFITTGVAIVTGAAFHLEYASNETNAANNPVTLLPFDSCYGHPINNAYHYHAKSWECFPDKGETNKHSPLFGYGLDGFGIFGPRSLGGKLVTNDDLDECHGHIHKIDWDGKKVKMYHYHLNTEFPYSIGCFRGTPVDLNETLRTTCILEDIKVVSLENMTEVLIKTKCL